MLQVTEMERQGRRGQPKPFADLTGRYPIPSRLHQQTENIQPAFLRESGKRRDGVCFFHISIIIEMWKLSTGTSQTDRPINRPTVLVPPDTGAPARSGPS